MTLISCPECGCELTKEMIDVNMCFECGFIIDKTLFDGMDDKDEIEEICIEKISQELVDNQEIETEKLKRQISEHILTSGYNFEGYRIIKYKGIICGHSFIGAGVVNELKANFSEVFGVESEAFTKKIEDAKQIATERLIKKSIAMGGNAIIGVDFDYITFPNNILGVSANGTSVTIIEIIIS